MRKGIGMSLRRRALLPMLAVVVATFGVLALLPQTLAERSESLWAAGALLLLGMAVLFEYTVRRPLAALAGTPAAHDEIAAVDERIRALRTALDAREEALAQARAQTRHAQSELREQEVRYITMVKGANDGIWEWDVRDDTLYISPRWKGMLGYAMDELDNTLACWLGQVHADERDAVRQALTRCVQGETAGFESEHRVLCRNGGERWVLSRGTLLRNAGGTAYRLIGLDTDITRQRRMQNVLRHLAKGTAGATGDEFFRELVRHFAAIFGVRQAFVTECVNFPTTRVRPLATWDGGRFIDDPEYDLADTPCEEVVLGNRIACYPDGVDQRYACSARQGFHSYYGMPIADSAGRVIGHLAMQGPETIEDEVIHESVFKIFAARAAAELERRSTLRMVLEMANGLTFARGDEALRALARAFAAVTQMREAFVAECVEQPPRSVRVLAWWRRGEFLPAEEYAVNGSVCEETILQGRVCQYSSGVGRRFNYGGALDWESYISVPFFDASHRVAGHLAAVDDRPLRRPAPDEAILRLFAERAGAELEHRRLDAGNGVSPISAVDLAAISPR